MTLDVYLEDSNGYNVFDGNITNSLVEMEQAAGLYQPLWHPELLGINTAEQLAEPLWAGLRKLRKNHEKFKKLNPENGCGDYDELVAFVKEYLIACIEHPNAKVRVSR